MVIVQHEFGIFGGPAGAHLLTLLNGLTLASLYFIVASGFTLVFGLAAGLVFLLLALLLVAEWGYRRWRGLA